MNFKPIIRVQIKGCTFSFISNRSSLLGLGAAGKSHHTLKWGELEQRKIGKTQEKPAGSPAVSPAAGIQR